MQNSKETVVYFVNIVEQRDLGVIASETVVRYSISSEERTVLYRDCPTCGQEKIEKKEEKDRMLFSGIVIVHGDGLQQHRRI